MEIKILLAQEDEDFLLNTFCQLKKYGYIISLAGSGKEVLNILNRERIDAILLDTDFADCNGNELCTRIRSDEIGYDGPVIFFSSLKDSESIVDAFRSGGTDYIVKPAKGETLKERIEINLKKFNGQERYNRKKWFRHFMVDQGSHEVFRVQNGIRQEKIILSPKEYSLLDRLVEHKGEVLLYRQLYRDVWKQEDLDDVRTLMVHVSNLRKKLAFDNTEIIRAVRGTGYLFQDE